jgi:hypothetical protein
MLHSEIIAACFQIHTQHVTTLCGQNVGLQNVELAVRIVIDHWALRVNRNKLFLPPPPPQHKSNHVELSGHSQPLLAGP